MLAAARREGLPVTVETCPHYLHFAAEEIPDGATLFKCAPPIRSARQPRSAVAGAARRHHRPHRHRPLALPAGDEAPRSTTAPGEEPGRFDQAWGGIPSSPSRCRCCGPSARAAASPSRSSPTGCPPRPRGSPGLTRTVGSIEPGKHANFVVFDPDASFTVTADRLHYRHPISPYMGETLRGVVRATWLRGELRLRATASSPLAPHGREYALSCLLA